MAEPSHRVRAADRPAKKRGGGAQHIHLVIKNRHHPQRGEPLNPYRHRIDPAGQQNSVPQAAHGTACCDTGKHVGRQSQPH